MYIINNTKAQVRLPIKSLNQVLVLAVGEKSPELLDKLHNELIPFVRAFKLTIQGYGAASAGSVNRAHNGSVIQSDPKANSGDSLAKARIQAANDRAMVKSKAITDAVAANTANRAKATADKAAAAVELEEKSVKVEPVKPVVETDTKPKANAKSTDAKKASTAKSKKPAEKRPRRKALSRKS